MGWMGFPTNSPGHGIPSPCHTKRKGPKAERLVQFFKEPRQGRLIQAWFSFLVLLTAGVEWGGGGGGQPIR